MGALIIIQFLRDVDTLNASSLSERVANHSLTSVELLIVWGIVGAVLYVIARKKTGFDSYQTRSSLAIPDADAGD
jgi:hypothetical protein